MRIRVTRAAICIASLLTPVPLLAAAHSAAAPEPAEKTAASPASDASEVDAAAGNGAGDTGELAKQSQNPIADLISVPFQENLNYNIGSYERASSTLNIQPVIPVKLSPDWMLITRTIVPIVYQPNVDSTGGGSSGLGDVNPAFLFSPVKHGAFMWGVGPAFLLPTATQRAIGTGKWSVGVTAAGVLQPGKLTIGVLATNLWSVSGPEDRTRFNQISIQYFVNYNLRNAWYLTSAPILTADWQAEPHDVWTIPFGGGVGKIFKLGKLPLNGTVQMYRNVFRPDFTPSPAWQLRIQVAFLFPTGKPPAAKPSEVASVPRR